MFCDQCGEKLIKGSGFCDNCGFSVIESEDKKEGHLQKDNFLKKYKIPIAITLLAIFIFTLSFYLNSGGEIKSGKNLNQNTVINQKLDEAQQKLKELAQSNSPNKNTQIEELQKEVAELKKQQQSFATASAKKDSNKLSNSEIIAKVKPAVVYIETTEGMGSGMIIDSEGYILTNAHVVEGVSSTKIILSDKRTFTGYVIGRNNTIDLAILKIYSSDLRSIEIGDSDEISLKQGDEVFALGYPFGLEGDVSFKEGTISRRHVFDGITYLETSAEIHPGNSGGPLVNKMGQVVGVNTAIYGKQVSGISVGETIKFALPINFVKVFIPQLKSGGQVSNPNVSQPQVSSPSYNAPVSQWPPSVGSTVTIPRRILVAMAYNSNLSCVALTFTGDDLKLCDLYKYHKDEYYWNIVD